MLASSASTGVGNKNLPYLCTIDTKQPVPETSSAGLPLNKLLILIHIEHA